jgi:CheY-like chemotaxis protein
VKISVELIDKTGDSLRLIFKIKDSGIGISEEGKSMIFKEFSQSESSITRRFGGTGLGLAISKNLVNLMSGEIGVNSKLNQGSEFWFRLPLREPKIETSENKNLIDTIPKQLRILLAEDNIVNQLVAKLTLKQYGFECDVANNGQEAFELFQKNIYDLVLMDMQMPEVDGLQSTALIRNYEKENLKQNQAYIVALTANAMTDDKQRCLLAGMNNFLSKPFTEKEINKREKHKWKQ